MGISSDQESVQKVPTKSYESAHLATAGGACGDDAMVTRDQSSSRWRGLEDVVTF